MHAALSKRLTASLLLIQDAMASILYCLRLATIQRPQQLRVTTLRALGGAALTPLPGWTPGAFGCIAAASSAWLVRSNMMSSSPAGAVVSEEARTMLAGAALVHVHAGA